MKKNMTSNANSDFERLLYTTQTKVFRKKKNNSMPFAIYINRNRSCFLRKTD